MRDRLLALLMFVFIIAAMFGVFAIMPQHYADPLPNYFATPMSRSAP